MTNPIDHVIVIVKENHTFDNYFSGSPGIPAEVNARVPTESSAGCRRSTKRHADGTNSYAVAAYAIAIVNAVVIAMSAIRTPERGRIAGLVVGSEGAADMPIFTKHCDRAAMMLRPLGSDSHRPLCCSHRVKKAS